jgi:hypothetical protein
MTDKPGKHPLTRPAEDTIIKHITANPEFAHALHLEADALKPDEPDVAARLNHWLGKALYLAEKKTTFTRFEVLKKQTQSAQRGIPTRSAVTIKRDKK